MCGNGQVEAGEECDDANDVDIGDVCHNDCTKPRCFDGVFEIGETCFDGQFTTYPALPSGASATSATRMVLADCDADGDDDVVVLGIKTEGGIPVVRRAVLTTLVNEGGTLVPATPLDDTPAATVSPAGGTRLEVGNFATNPADDVVAVIGDTFVVGFGNGCAAWSYDQARQMPAPIVAASALPRQQGRDHVAVAYEEGATTSFIHYQYTGVWTTMQDPNPNGQLGDMVAADLNGDGFGDVVYTSMSPRRVSVWLFFPPQGTFVTEPDIYPLGSGTTGAAPGVVAIADMGWAPSGPPNDHPDLLTLNLSDETITVLKNDEADPPIFNLFQDDQLVVGQKSTLEARKPRDFALSDIDLDGDRDVFVINDGDTEYPPSLMLLMNVAQGGFANADTSLFPKLALSYPHELPKRALTVSVSDMNGDGVPDVVMLLEGDEVAVALASP
ncbi:MAG: FG-GAP-like repeat-containing protein [Polyangiaceae bacterium]